MNTERHPNSGPLFQGLENSRPSASKAWKTGVAAPLLASALAATAAAGVGQPVRPVPDAEHRAWLAAAPVLPIELDLGLDLRLIDFVDCTNPGTPHDFLDQGTSRVVVGPAGRYRITAPHRHAFFSYGFRTAGRDNPILLVIEYPDDDDRVISFMTHDSMRATRPHLSFSQETGVYTGGAFPRSNRMRYFTLVSWPQDDWSPLLTLNFGRTGGGGAAARFWVYAIERFHSAALETTEGAGRQLDMFFPLAFLAVRDNFGWRSPRSVEHLADYLQWLGLNRVTMMVYANQSWGALCTIPAWDAKDDGYLEKILTTLDQRGGIRFIAGIVADGMYGNVTAEGKKVAEMEPAEARNVILKGLDEFIERYGGHSSLGGLAFGSMEAVGFMDMLRTKGLLEEAVAHVKARRPDWDVITYVGNYYLQTPHFQGRNGPTTAAVIREWETSTVPWLDFIGAKIAENWRNWKRDPNELQAVPGFHVYEMFHPDDHRLHDLYRQEPRAPIFFDTERSPNRGAKVSRAAIFGTFTEGFIGLHKDVNWHYTKPWTAPEFNPPEALGMSAFARALGLRDRVALSAGGWSVKYFGLDPHIRRFARHYRRLPAADMVDAPAPPECDYVVVRWVKQGERRHLYALSLIPFDSTVKVDGREIALQPFDLVSWTDESDGAPKVEGAPPETFRTWVQARLDRYDALRAAVAQLDPAAAPDCYLRHGEAARAAFAQGRVRTADDLLGLGLPNELELRRQILDRPQMTARPTTARIVVNGDTNDWPDDIPPIVSEDGAGIAGHIYFPNSWTGPDDLSARVRLAHDGANLYVLVEVRDDRPHEKDNVRISFSKTGYRDWRADDVKFDLNLQVRRPGEQPTTATQGSARTAARQTLDGFIVEASVPLATLGVTPGGEVGMHVVVQDVDVTDNLSKHAWAVKQALLIPHAPNFAFWSDARNSGRVFVAPVTPGH